MPPDLNAAQLDRYIAAETAYDAAKAAGKTEEEALEAARQAVAEKRRQQVLRSVGVPDDVIEASRP